jgi:hypothetical protein
MSHNRMNDEFYIGYESGTPPGVRRRIRLAVAAIVAVGSCVAIVVLFAQRPFARARFEYGARRPFSGTLVADPYPSLIGGAGARRLWLVAPGKFGADDLVRPVLGRAVELEGSLIERGPDRMIEIAPGTIEAADEPAEADPREEALGPITLRGEIVDGKCFLGVMNPGQGVVHRDCAIRCLRGGMPPMLRVVDQDGRAALIALVGADGRAIGRELADMAAEPIEVVGTLSRRGDALFLAAEPGAYRRVR